jgi:hypothetical protein
MEKSFARVGARVCSEQDLRLTSFDCELVVASGIFSACTVKAPDSASVVGTVDPLIFDPKLESG